MMPFSINFHQNYTGENANKIHSIAPNCPIVAKQLVSEMGHLAQSMTLLKRAL